MKGWLTTDAEELQRRRERARSETFVVESLTPEHDPFGDFAIRSEKGARSYRVEIRARDERDNSCTCRDFLHNGLGTCKHIEAVHLQLETSDATASPRTEIFLVRRGGTPRIRLRGSHPAVNEFFAHDEHASELDGDPIDLVPELERACAELSSEIRLSRDVVAWAAELRRRRDRETDRAAYLKTAASARELLKEPLYPFQREGMLHLAFGERAMLADDLGLGKTVQALAAAELLRQRRGIERVLIVCPASLKSQWAEQIERFSGLPCLQATGSRTQRRRAYRAKATDRFYTIAHYEQVRSDAADINELLAPDLVILDEAQRIKSWNTKTARAVKQLASTYAFVLTGTPLENRIDEIYSIAEFLDPQLFGPLFRFNREFYKFDSAGRPVGFKNLPELHRRVQSILLRRRRGAVEAELPPLTVNSYYVGMTPLQRRRYAQQQDKVLALAREDWTDTAPLEDPLPPAIERLRRLCDAAEIPSAKSKSKKSKAVVRTEAIPKLVELERVFDDIFSAQDTERKAIVFSEWTGMLDRVAELAETLGLGALRHTGDVPIADRPGQLQRFAKDPDIRLLLCTDIAGTGLNLQSASVVINLDLPWSPAAFQQRVARAWRLEQQHPVAVINLVSKDSIEARLLRRLDAAGGLARVLDPDFPEEEMQWTTVRSFILEQLTDLFAPTPPGPPPVEQVRAELHTRLGSRLQRLDEVNGVLLAVVDQRDAASETIARELSSDGLRIELLDTAQLAALRRMVESGLMKPDPGMQALFDEETEQVDEDWLALARRQFEDVGGYLEQGENLLRSGLMKEALPPLRDALNQSLEAMYIRETGSAPEPLPLALAGADLIEPGLLPRKVMALASQCRGIGGEADESLASGVRELVDLVARSLQVA